MTEIFYRPHPALCQDGVTRSVRVRSYWDGRAWCWHADTFFSVPARVSIRGKTVTGFVMNNEDGVLCFHAYKYRKNHALAG